MSKFTFQLPDGKSFEIKGPPELTLEQARAIFEKQAETGALVGLKAGDVLNAAKQAAGGLEAAKAQLTQGLGQLPSGVSGLVSQAQGIAGQAQAVLNNAVSNIPVSVPIDTADFVKATTALAPLKSLGVPEVTGVVAQAKNIAGQVASAVSNVNGLGEFGLDVKQLETAGIVKPGVSALIERGAQLTEVLKSPAVFTGKDGIRGVTDLLQNPAKQAEIQQQLMASGTAALAAVGVPIDDLTPDKLAGVALAAAKSVSDAEQLLKNLPSPADIKAKFDSTVKDAAYAVNLVKNKLPDALKDQAAPVVATATVARDTLNAATNRVLGNAKLPSPSFGPVPVSKFLYAKTKDQDLVYAGADPIVWDRVNQERLRRGLPGLETLGYPRPENK